MSHCEINRYSGYRASRETQERLCEVEHAVGIGGSDSTTGSGNGLQPANWAMPALATSADGDLATASAIAATPVSSSLVAVIVNGAIVTVGNGNKLAACYFSDDGGVSAKLISNITAGDKLYWMGSVAGFQLQSNFLVGFLYVS